MEFKEGYPLTHVVHNETFDETFTAYMSSTQVLEKSSQVFLVLRLDLQ